MRRFLKSARAAVRGAKLLRNTPEAAVGKGRDESRPGRLKPAPRVVFLRSSAFLILGIFASPGAARAQDASPTETTLRGTPPAATTVTSVASAPTGVRGAAASSVESLTDVKRIYVAPLTGGKGREALRDLIIASVSASHEFVITENEERADAILKGAADDEVFTDRFNSNDSTTVHANVGAYGAAVKGAGRGPGAYAGESASEHESIRDQERKHEAYAAVRLCNKDGDVIWSTTQESMGAKFRGAGADVAARVAKQLVLDLDKARRREFETPVPSASMGLAPTGSTGTALLTGAASSAAHAKQQ